MKAFVAKLTALALLAILVVPLIPLQAAVAQEPIYSYFPSALPSAATNDGRMLSLAGRPLNTLAGATMSLVIMVPSDSTSFEIGIFDGDTGKDGAGNLNPSGGHWDLGTSQLIFELYADPYNIGSETDDSLLLLGEFFGNDPNPTSTPLWTASSATMPDNDWWTLSINNTPDARAPSGHYFYHMHVYLSDPETRSEASFKIRSTGTLAVHHDDVWGFIGSARQLANDGPIIYPEWDGFTYPPDGSDFWLNTPTTYDGSWVYFLDVPVSLSKLGVWDGDFDFGSRDTVGSPSGQPIQFCADDDDLHTPGDGYLPPWAVGTAALPEGAKGAGSPPDDYGRDFFRRSPCVVYQVTDPLGNTYREGNSSGNSEWEALIITTDPAATEYDADYGPNVSSDGQTFVTTDPLPAGIWRIDVSGLDLANLNFFKFPFNTLGVCEDGGLCKPVLRPYLLGDYVWYDSNGDGLQDEGPGAAIAGVVVNLLDSNGSVIGTTTTDANGSYFFEVDGYREDRFGEVLIDGIYTVQIAPENFQPGGALEGLQSTTGGEEQTDFVEQENVLTYDFGYKGGSIGDRIWNDANGDGVQDAGEEGIAGVTVNLLDGEGNVIATTTTGPDGFYLFEDLPAGDYTVVVDASTLPDGYVQTYDLDDGTGPFGTPNSASLYLGPGQERDDVDFGYRFDYSPGTGTPGYWKNHPEAWPVEEITIGGVTYTKDEAIAWLQTNNKKDKTITLFRALVAAKLNVLIGNESSCIDDTIVAADEWMAEWGPVGSKVRGGGEDSPWRDGQPLSQELDDYNNGLLCAPHRN